MTIRSSKFLPLGGLLSFALILALAGCGPFLSGPSKPAASIQTVQTPTRSGGIGGTGARPAPSTVPAAPLAQGGIGGTGIVAGGIGGTGIVGTITGFASILVNGLEVDFAPDQPVSIKDRLADPGVLRVGQLVEIEAAGSGDRLSARRITVQHEVSGVVTAIDGARGEIEVLGQRVRIDPATLRDGPGTAPSGPLAGIAVGQRLDVSGQRDASGVINATRLDLGEASDRDRITGRVTATDATGFNIGNLRVDTAGPAVLRDIQVGSRVDIAGRSEGRRLRAVQLRPRPAVPFGGRYRRLSVEGFVARGADGIGRLHGLPVQIGTSTRLQNVTAGDLQAGRRVIMDGVIGAGNRFEAQRYSTPSRQLQPGRTNAAPPLLRPQSETSPLLQRQSEPLPLPKQIEPLPRRPVEIPSRQRIDTLNSLPGRLELPARPGRSNRKAPLRQRRR